MQKITEAMRNNRAAFIARLTSCLDDKNILVRGRKTKLAHLAGITPRAVYNWYNLTSGPSREHVTPIARWLQVEVDYLLSGTTPVPEGSVIVKPMMAGPNAQGDMGVICEVEAPSNAIKGFRLSSMVSNYSRPTMRVRIKNPEAYLVKHRPDHVYDPLLLGMEKFEPLIVHRPSDRLTLPVKHLSN